MTRRRTLTLQHTKSGNYGGFRRSIEQSHPQIAAAIRGSQRLGNKNCSTTTPTRVHYLRRMRAVQPQLTTMHRWRYTVTTGTLVRESAFSQQREKRSAEPTSHDPGLPRTRPAGDRSLSNCVEIRFKIPNNRPPCVSTALSLSSLN